MKLAEIYARHAQPGIDKLSKESGLSVAYIRRILYVLDRRPSFERAARLIKASEKLWGKKNALTLDGLTNPVFYKDAIEEALEQGVAHEKWVLQRSRERAQEAATSHDD